MTSMSGDLTAGQRSETLPPYLDYSRKPLAPPCETTRYYETPINGATFSAGSTVKIDIAAGSPGCHLDASQTFLSFDIVNTTSQALVLDGGAECIIEGLDVYHGATQISSISSYNAYARLLQDFGTGLDDAKTAGTIRGVRDYATADVAGFYSSNGVSIAATTGRVRVAVPLANLLGSHALKAIPLSQLLDSIRLEIRLAPADQWGVYAAVYTGTPAIDNVKLNCTLLRIDGAVERALIQSLGGVVCIPTFDVRNYQTSVAASAGAISWQIPVRLGSITAIYIVMRLNTVLSDRSKRAMARTRAKMIDYRFRIGSRYLPASAVDCTGSACEARVELMRAMQQIGHASPRHSVGAAQYVEELEATHGGFAIGLNLAAFSASDLLSDGVSSRADHIVFEARLASDNPAVRVDAFAVHEKVLVAQSGILRFEE